MTTLAEIEQVAAQCMAELYDAGRRARAIRMNTIALQVIRPTSVGWGHQIAGLPGGLVLHSLPTPHGLLRVEVDDNLEDGAVELSEVEQR